MASSRPYSLFRRIVGKRRQIPSEINKGTNLADEANDKGPNSELGKDIHQSSQDAQEPGVPISSGVSVMKILAYAVAVAAAAAFGFALGGGVTLLFNESAGELDPNSEVGLELARLDGDLETLRQAVEDIVIPDPGAESNAELELQSLENRIGDLESRIEEFAKSRQTDASRLEALSKADGDFSNLFAEQAKLADAHASELKTITGNLSDLSLLRDEVSEIRNKMDQMPVSSPGSPELAAKFEAFDQRLASIEERPATFSNSGGEESNLSGQIESLLANDRRLDSKLDSLQSETADLTTLPGELERIFLRIQQAETKIDTLSNLTADNSDSQMNLANEQKLSAMESDLIRIEKETASALDSARKEIAALDSEIRTSLDSAATRIAYSRIFDAIYSGRSYSELLADVDWVQPNQSETLAYYAETGIKSLEELEDLFLDRARKTLKGAQIEGDSEQGVTTFLKSLVVVRSLSPQEGNDVGSILSRAEAALNDGRLRASLNLVSSLPENSRQSMKEWSDAVVSRLAVLDAIRMPSSLPSKEPRE